MDYKVYYKGNQVRHVNFNDGSELRLVPFEKTDVTKKQFEQMRDLIEEPDSVVLDASVGTESEKSEEDTGDEEEQSNTSLDDTERGDLMNLASELNYKEKTGNKIVSAKNDELIEFIKQEKNTE